MANEMLEFMEFIVQKDSEGIWRRCPYCGTKVWDGPHTTRATGFSIHLSQKMPGHEENPSWKAKFGKGGSWMYGTQLKQ